MGDSSGTPRAFPQVKKQALGERREEFRMMGDLHISPSYVIRIPYLDVNKKHYISRF
jgi:hypothetical protein